MATSKDLHNISIPMDDWKLLRMEAARLGTSASWIIRGLIDNYLHQEQLLTEEQRELAYRMAFDKVVAPREHTPGAGQIRLANGQAVDLGSGINAMAPGRAQETREDG